MSRSPEIGLLEFFIPSELIWLADTPPTLPAALPIAPPMPAPCPPPEPPPAPPPAPPPPPPPPPAANDTDDTARVILVMARTAQCFVFILISLIECLRTALCVCAASIQCDVVTVCIRKQQTGMPRAACRLRAAAGRPSVSGVPSVRDSIQIALQHRTHRGPCRCQVPLIPALRAQFAGAPGTSAAP
ncbi:hypothetical protein GWC77_20190 [Paraburkholderia sp. NMBU_R16]|nr:hypothetical protein [Paraburkholderia sp. NMBU_R16]